tara:strand:- start:7636 stop:8085 length:450 start_codon:yes stop_codon:yes gene_type:complete
MYYFYNTTKKKLNNVTSILGGKKYKNYTKQLIGGILDNISIKKSKKIKKSLHQLKNNSKIIGNIAQNSLNHFLDLASNSTDIAQNALINTYKILAPNQKVEKEVQQEILKINPNKQSNKKPNKSNKKPNKSNKKNKYINEWEIYNRTNI